MNIFGKVFGNVVFCAIALLSVWTAHMWWNWTMLSLHVALLAGMKVIWEHRKTLIKFNENIQRLSMMMDRVDVMWNEREERRITPDRRQASSEI